MGRLVHGATGQPLRAAFVVLVDTTGAERGGVLTSPDGRYALRAPGPGRYSVRAELIGYATHTSPPLELSGGETRTWDVTVSVRAIELASIEVEGERRCAVRPGPGLRTAELWDEARKALRLAVWTEDRGAVRFRAVRFRRELDPRTLRVLSEERTPLSGYTRRGPYMSRPADDLAENGYIRPGRDGSWDYFAPDARVLLSDSFLDGHCFELSGHDSRPELVGLAFRPVERGDEPDIRGVLWLDRATAELRHLEFAYTELPYPVESSQVGGRVDFDRLAGGPWIVRSWHIRMPRVELERVAYDPLRVDRDRYRLAGIQEQGAEVEEVLGTGDVSLLEGSVGGSVTGVVQGPAGAGVGAGVRVSLVGTAHASRTTAAGTFEMHGLREGSYALSVAPGTRDLPWPVPVAAEVTVREGDTTHVELRLPTPDELVGSLCGDAASDSLPGVVFGRAADPSTGRPVPARDVVVTWGRFGLTPDRLGVTRQWAGTTAVTDDGGWYLACGVPVSVPVRVRAVPAGDTPDEAIERLWRPPVLLPPGAREIRLFRDRPLRRVDLELAVGWPQTRR